MLPSLICFANPLICFASPLILTLFLSHCPGDEVVRALWAARVILLQQAFDTLSVVYRSALGAAHHRNDLRRVAALRRDSCGRDQERLMRVGFVSHESRHVGDQEFYSRGLH